MTSGNKGWEIPILLGGQKHGSIAGLEGCEDSAEGMHLIL